MDNNSLYFFAYYWSEQKEESSNFNFVVPEDDDEEPTSIIKDEKYENKKFYYKKIFKVEKPTPQDENSESQNYYFEFEIEENKYILSFEALKKKNFIFEINLEVGKRILDIQRKINQNVIDDEEKINFFIEALKKDKEEDLIDGFFKEAINLYSQTKEFFLLISLFLKIYKNKDICPLLLKEFNSMNINNEGNIDRKQKLKNYKDIFDNIIKKEAEQLINDNNYNFVEFYGIILCYLNYYDNNNFCYLIKELSKKNAQDLYEILLIYHTHLINPLEQDDFFLNKFIEYSIDKKKFKFFQIGLNYIKDVEILIKILEKNKEKIYNIFFKSENSKDTEKYIIKIDKNIKIKKENIEENLNENSMDMTPNPEEEKNSIITGSVISTEENYNAPEPIKNDKDDSISYNERKKKVENFLKIIKNINSIIDFSIKKKIFYVNFKVDFWKNQLNSFKEPNQDNIQICYKLREAFINYKVLVNQIFAKKEKSTIKKDTNKYFEIDEFAFLLNQIINRYIKDNENLKNIEKLRFITKYNPYYNEAKYSNKVDSDILDIFKLENIDNDFVEDFKKQHFESVFKDNLHGYISKITSKIKTISNFEDVIKLINIKKIDDKKIFFDSLKKRYDIIKKEIETLKGEDLKKARKVIVDLAILNYIYEEKRQKLNFIKNIIKKLPKKIIPLIYIDILKIYIDKEKEKQKKKKEEEERKNKKGEEKKKEEVEIEGREEKERKKEKEKKKKEKKKKKEEEEEEEEKEKEKETDLTEMKKFIFEEFVNKVENEEDIDNILRLIDCLESQSKPNKGDAIIEINEKKQEENERTLNEFLKILMEKNTFKKEEFFSDKENIKILLLYKLNEKEKIKKSDEDYYENIQNILKEIKEDFDGKIKKKKLEEFMKNNKNFIIQRISLIKIIYENYNPSEEYDTYNKKINKIQEDINKLKNTKDNIIIYFPDSKKEFIKELIENIKNSENKPIELYKGETINDLIYRCGLLDPQVKQIEKVKDFLLFNIIYENNKTSNNEEENFNKALDKLEAIGKILLGKNVNDLYKDSDLEDTINKIKEKISNNEEKAQNFINTFIDFYEIKDDNLQKDLTILFKSKKYEIDINSMIFFFEYFDKENIQLNKYKDLSKKNFKDIKDTLEDLKKSGKYNYDNIQNYNKLFTCLKDKKEAIDYLFNKKEEDFEYLENRIEPTNRTIKIKDILDTKACVFHINKMKNMDFQNRFDYIKGLNPEIISQFLNFSKKYLSIIDLDLYYDDSENIYEQVSSIIQRELVLNIGQDEESFLYYNNENKIEIITMEKLMFLKNKIPPIPIKVENDGNGQSEKNNKIHKKHKELIFFKGVLTQLETIIEYMKVLRAKGSSLPIKISIKIEKMNKITYELDKKEVDFNFIRNYLINVKNNYISQLDLIYKEKVNLRFFYGKQFRSIIQHLENSLDIEPFLRYILNNKGSHIEGGYKTIIREAKDYINQYQIYNKNSLDSISMYITSLFIANEKTLEGHYDRMKIIPINQFKGIYLNECESNSMEEYILDLFWEKMNELPIAQNILITGKETSSEEMQSFFHRAILCNYNTLFVVELNDSFSENQQSIMNSYIDQLLSFKKNKYNELTLNNVEKRKTHEYLDSCIVFIYEEKNNLKINYQITSFLKEMDKFETGKITLNKYNLNNELSKLQTKTIDISDFENQRKNKNIRNKNNKTDFDINKTKTQDSSTEDKSKNNNKRKKKEYISKLTNVKVITSDICGLGKSGKIKKDIEDNKKDYYHFPLGGILTKKIIFKKLENLIEKIKKDKEEDKSRDKYKNVAIHLDLTESKEKSIVNEFFFSFLITKFYSNNESIIYIPNDISIYIEIPNCFENYLDKYSLLKIFTIENISFQTMPEFNYPHKILDILYRMKKINTNTKIGDWVKEHIGFKKYSFHQINIFINLFISQYSKFKDKIYFKSNNIDVTDECIEEFSKCTQYFTNGHFAKLLTGEIQSDKKDYISKLTEIYDNDLKNMSFPSPLIFIIKEKMLYDEFYVPDKNSNLYKSSEDYLSRIKELLNLPNEVDKDIGDKKSLLSIIKENNYVITNDNFKKMVLLIYRIKANVPVIIMGDTGCGKTALITKLNELLNNGQKTVEIINIHPGIDDEKLCEIMDNKEKIAKNHKDELWLFFDEINTCSSLSLMTEIFIKRTYNGNKLSDNIRLIGACNPYRKRKNNKEKCGLNFPDDNDELVYLVNPLPQSLLYYVFSFGSLDTQDEKKYIHSIIENLFTKEDEKYLHEKTTEAISQCHIYLRKTFDASVVSLREIARFPKLVSFFQDYFRKKNKYEEKPENSRNSKIRSIICSIYLCYYFRLTDDIKRNNFEAELRPIFLELVNNKKTVKKNGNLIEQITNEDLKNEIDIRQENINKFGDFIQVEEDYLYYQINPDKGIGENSLLKENLFLLFVSLVTNIPIIIIGKPGTGKSLSVQLINKCMKGKYSDKGFFKEFPKIIQTYFQGSDSTKPEDIEILFEKAKKKLENIKKKNLEKINEDKLEMPISEVLFDELGLAERSKFNPLKALHPELDYAGKNEGVSFIGISNYSLDAAKLNRALVCSVPDLDQKIDELINTARNIAESYSQKIKDNKIFEILSHTYYEYKKKIEIIKKLNVLKLYNKYKVNTNPNKIDENLEEIDENYSDTSEITSKQNDDNSIEEKNKNKQRDKGTFESIVRKPEYKDIMKKEKKIRKDFHGNRDFYNLIKGIANELGKSAEFNDNEKVDIIIKYIERNFGGIEYEIDINFNLVLDDIKNELELIQKIIEGCRLKEENKIKLNSVYLFKKLYNLKCEDMKEINLKIDENKLNDYDLNKCINDNIKDNNSRYLLLEIRQSLTTLIYENIKSQNPFKEKTKIYDGSPFENDDNNDYRFKKINDIQEDAKDDKLIIIENLNQIHPFLFDLYNMNYEIIDDEKYARICLDSFKELKTLVNDKFRIIIIVDKNFVRQCNLAFLNRFEKIIVSFDKLLDNELKMISNELINDIDLKNRIKDYNYINYSFKNLLINSNDSEIQGLIYYFSRVSKNENEFNDEEDKKEVFERLKGNVIDKIHKVLPQDIIAVLPRDNIIQKKYIACKNIYNFKDYLDFINKESKYKISIIYTFTSIANIVEGLNSAVNLMITDIKSENDFLNLIVEIKKSKDFNKLQNENDNYICINFEQTKSKNIKFITNLILNNFNQDNYNYLILVHINRDFQKKNNEKIIFLPDINPDVYQIFIDNLNGSNKITLKDLLQKDIKKIINEYKEDLKLDDEFFKISANFLREELDKKYFDNDKKEEYIKEIEEYFENHKLIKENIVELIFKLYDNLKEDNYGGEDDSCRYIIDKIYEENIINSFTVDIVSCFVEYIRKEILLKNLKTIFRILEDNNILTTIIENQKNKAIDEDIIENLLKKYFNEIVIENNQIYDCKFIYNFNVPGFYNFFESIHNYINKNISLNYINNEKMIRILLQEDIKKLQDFQDDEENLIKNLYSEIKNNHKFNYEAMNIVSKDLILKDYITFYLQNRYEMNNIYNKDDIYHKIIEILFKLRFNDNNKIIKSGDAINILLLKIIWLESNANNILNILKIIEQSLMIFDNDENLLYDKIYELYKKNSIKYIINKGRNHEITKEVNECYYILLAIICYCITSNEIKKEKIFTYCNKLKEINRILQILNDDLFIYLNEMYIIDELIKIIELYPKYNQDLEKIESIKRCIRENAEIIQKNFDKEEPNNLSEELIKNFEDMYRLIMKNEDLYNKDEEYFDKLRYILFKEIEKINDINYRQKILSKLLEEDIMIKKSNDVFQLLLKKYFDKTKFSEKIEIIKINKDNSIKKLKTEEDIIIRLLEKKLINNKVLEETLLYLFEKNSLNYLNSYILKKKVSLEEEPLEILKVTINYLDDYINKPEELKSKAKELYKLFCLGYIKTFCYIYLKMYTYDKPKMNDPKKIIEVLKSDKSINKMICIYIYKILYNKYTIDFFKDENNISKYNLEGFSKIIDVNELSAIYRIDYNIKTLESKKYEKMVESINKYKKDNFSKEIKVKDFNIEGFGIDNFFIASYNSVLANLLVKSSEININFYNKVCKVLFKDDILKIIELFYETQKYEETKRKYGINPNNIKPLLFGYRYCLNELFSKKGGIYKPLYNIKNINYLREKLYPGNDTKLNLVYSQIVNHFKTKPNEGCYVCLCKDWYYHSVPSGFPGNDELNMICPKCYQNIGASKKDNNDNAIMIRRDNYFRIFKDDEEIEKTKKNNKTKLNEIKNYYITLKEFKEKYVLDIYKKEKGVHITDKNSFNNDKKIIRNLSQISYRILNFILYSHLFFARVITNSNEFDKYLPKGMNWIETLNQCWNIIKNELLKIKIDTIEKFMHYIFPDLFIMLNCDKSINDYNELLKLEESIEKEIQIKIKNFEEYHFELSKNINKTSNIYVLKEIYSSYSYDPKDFPFYDFFYYTDYLDEKYINEKLNQKDDNNYPVLREYLKFKNKEKDDKVKYLLDNFHIFNNALNLINQQYFYKITRERAEKESLKDTEIYIQNKQLFEDFIKFYNNEIKEIKMKEQLTLGNENSLRDFFIREDNKFGKSYKIIYKLFIKQQNDNVEKLLNMKIEKGIFDKNCKNKVDVQQIKENEIFNLNLDDNNSFIDIIFNSSYRKILDIIPIRYNLYREYVINYNFIEELMTDLLLKNKKLLNENITEFIYNNELFNNQISNLVTSFTKRYITKNMIISDKVAIYKFCKKNKNIPLYKTLINDFIELIKYLNNIRKDNNKDSIIKEETKIYEISDKINSITSNHFMQIFEKQNGLTIDKTSDIFEYFLKVIFEELKNDIKKYQVNIDEKTKEMINKYNEKDKKHIIFKKDLAYAIRLFISLVLIQEDDKETKIKLNENNVINYLKSEDLWKNGIYNSDKFNKNLDEFKMMNIHINQIIPLYDALGKDIETNFFDDVERQIKEEEHEDEVEENGDEEKEKDEEKSEEKEKDEEKKSKFDGEEEEDEEEEENEDKQNAKDRF